MEKINIDKIIKTEGNYKQFDYGGYKCEIKRMNEMGHLCGYVTKTEIDMIPRETLLSYDVHGGITYIKHSTIGFDCAHAGDYVPALNKFGGTYRTMSYVENEIKSLVEQIIITRRDIGGNYTF